MQEICPISEEQIDEKIVRTNAALVSLSLMIFLYIGNANIILFLVVDFLIRGFRLDLPSPIGTTSRFTTKILNLRYKAINAAPKVFAAKIGFILSTVIALFSYLDFAVASYTLASVMLTFSLFESLLGICVACKVYTICCRLGIIK